MIVMKKMNCVCGVVHHTRIKLHSTHCSDDVELFGCSKVKFIDFLFAGI